LDILGVKQIVKFSELCLVAALGAIAGCGGANSGPLGPGGRDGAAGGGGTGNPPPVDQSTFLLTCENGTLQLNIPIELVVELTEPYSSSRSTEATFSAAVILDEESVASLIDADATLIDISASVTTNVTGATPATMTASLGAPLDDFDLQSDPDDNGMPGPHRLELDPMTATSNAAPEAKEVAFKLDFDGISLTLDIFNIPADCFGPSLVGVAVRFPVNL
jgi:hypothetical protein